MNYLDSHSFLDGKKDGVDKENVTIYIPSMLKQMAQDKNIHISNVTTTALRYVLFNERMLNVNVLMAIICIGISLVLGALGVVLINFNTLFMWAFGLFFVACGFMIFLYVYSSVLKSLELKNRIKKMAVTGK